MRTTDYRNQMIRAMSENELEENIRDLCDQLGLWRQHTYDSRRSKSGWPDDTYVGGWVMYRELKKESGKVSPTQADCIARLRAAGADVDIWRPSDWYSDRIKRELRALARGNRTSATRPEETDNNRVTARETSEPLRSGPSDHPDQPRVIASATASTAAPGGAA